MKKLIFSLIAILVGCSATFAQKQMVVNTEKIFKAMPEYNKAIESIDNLAKQYQDKIDADYAVIGKSYNDYQTNKQYMNDSQRRTRENAIIAQENTVEKFQEEKFGQEGEIIKKRVDIIKPIQERVFGIISKYAQTNGYTIVLDSSSNPSLIYVSPTVDKTEEIIKLVK